MKGESGRPAALSTCLYRVAAAGAEGSDGRDLGRRRDSGVAGWPPQEQSKQRQLASGIDRVRKGAATR